jgi:hypothetical protein
MHSAENQSAVEHLKCNLLSGEKLMTVFPSARKEKPLGSGHGVLPIPPEVLF